MLTTTAPATLVGLEPFLRTITDGEADYCDLPILADWLEERGGTDRATLDTLRNPGDPVLHLTEYVETSTWPDNDPDGEQPSEPDSDTECVRDEAVTIEEAADALRADCWEPSCYPLRVENCDYVWFSTEFMVSDYQTGAEERHSLHFRLAGGDRRDATIPALLAYIVYRLGGVSIRV